MINPFAGHVLEQPMSCQCGGSSWYGLLGPGWQAVQWNARAYYWVHPNVPNQYWRSTGPMHMCPVHWDWIPENPVPITRGQYCRFRAVDTVLCNLQPVVFSVAMVCMVLVTWLLQ